MERKIKYEGPGMEIIMLGTEDVITTSLENGGTGSGIEFPWPGSDDASRIE